MAENAMKKYFYLDADGADVQFVFSSNNNRKRKIVPGHREFLAEKSEVFERMFVGQFKESQQEDVYIKGISMGAFKKFLSYFYDCNDDNTITMDNIAEMLCLADMYDVAACMNDCEQFMVRKMTPKNVFRFLELAIKLNRTELVAKLERLIAEDCEQSIETSAMKKLSWDGLKYLLDNGLLVCDPMKVFNACIGWAKVSCKRQQLDASKAENLRNMLGDCFYSIPFGSMKPNEIAGCMEEYKNLFDKDDLVELFKMVTVGWQSERFAYKKLNYQWKSLWLDMISVSWIHFGAKYLLNRIEKADFKDYGANGYLVAEVVFAPIFHDNADQKKLSGSLTIIETVRGSSTTLLTQPIDLNVNNNGSTTTIELRHPIVCSSSAVYTILITFGNNWAKEEYFVYHPVVVFRLQGKRLHGSSDE